MRAALETRRATLGPDHPEIASSLVVLASLARDRHDAASAEAQYREALAIRLKRLGQTSPQAAMAQVGLAEVLLDRGDRGSRAEAESLLNPALATLRAALKPGQADLVRAEAAQRRTLTAPR